MSFTDSDKLTQKYLEALADLMRTVSAVEVLHDQIDDNFETLQDDVLAPLNGACDSMRQLVTERLAICGWERKDLK